MSESPIAGYSGNRTSCKAHAIDGQMHNQIGKEDILGGTRQDHLGGMTPDQSNHLHTQAFTVC